MSDVATKLEAMLRRVVREESPSLDDLRRLIREEVPPMLERLADERQERRAVRLARRLNEAPKLSDDEAQCLRAWVAENEDEWRPVSRTPERWLSGKTSNPRRATVARWWTDTLGLPEPELIALLEGDDDDGGDLEGAESGRSPDGERAK